VHADRRVVSSDSADGVVAPPRTPVFRAAVPLNAAVASSRAAAARAARSAAPPAACLPEMTVPSETATQAIVIARNTADTNQRLALPLSVLRRGVRVCI